MEKTPEEKQTNSEVQENTEDKNQDESTKAGLTEVTETDFNVFQQYMQSFQNPYNMKAFGNKQFSELLKTHSFWDTQPVLKAQELARQVHGDKHGPLETKTKDEVQKEPYALPNGFDWGSIDLSGEADLEDLYKLLHDHYVEDDDGYFRFDYAKEFLRWALTPPNYDQELAFCIRAAKTGKVMAFISGIFIDLSVEGEKVKATEVNFLCVHKLLRKHKIAPILIQEVTRRSNVKGVWQGVRIYSDYDYCLNFQFFTSGQVLPTPFAQARYYHRSLNPKKLIDVQFSSLPKKQSLSMHEKLYSVSSNLTIPGVRLMEEKDVKAVKNILNSYLTKFELREVYSTKEVKHFFMPREKVMHSWVIETKGVITDFLSFYSLPSSILNHQKHKTLNAAYSYYIIPGTHSLKTLYENALILARQLEFDVFNALDILDNQEIFEDLFFKPGDGFLHYYFYNWQLKATYLLPKNIGKVLV